VAGRARTCPQMVSEGSEYRNIAACGPEPTDSPEPHRTSHQKMINPKDTSHLDRRLLIREELRPRPNGYKVTWPNASPNDAAPACHRHPRSR
jgi:hypothetical protein